jgi:hypothetical protein
VPATRRCAPPSAEKDRSPHATFRTARRPASAPPQHYRGVERDPPVIPVAPSPASPRASSPNRFRSVPYAALIEHRPRFGELAKYLGSRCHVAAHPLDELASFKHPRRPEHAGSFAPVRDHFSSVTARPPNTNGPTGALPAGRIRKNPLHCSRWFGPSQGRVGEFLLQRLTADRWCDQHKSQSTRTREFEHPGKDAITQPSRTRAS